MKRDWWGKEHRHLVGLYRTGRRYDRLVTVFYTLDAFY
jgi:hypothetical protein